MKDPNRMLFLAIPEEVWLVFFQKQLIQKPLARVEAKIIVYNPHENKIIQWIK